MIDIDDLMVFAGVAVLVGVAFHLNLWFGIAGVGVCLVAGGLAIGKMKAHRAHKGKN